MHCEGFARNISVFVRSGVIVIEHWSDDVPVTLARKEKEFEILALLAKNPNRIFKSEQLLDLVWQSKEVNFPYTKLYIS
nr:helix-turn-helix domain-containing protein [Desulfofundulus thermobenzoicus]